HQRKMAGKPRQRCIIHRRTQAIAILTGTSSASDQCSGQRMTPIAANVTSAIEGARAKRSRSSGSAILAQVPSTNPAAAAAMPTSMRCKAAKPRISQSEDRDDDEGRADQSDQRNQRSKRTANAAAENNG